MWALRSMRRLYAVISTGKGIARSPSLPDCMSSNSLTTGFAELVAGAFSKLLRRLLPCATVLPGLRTPDGVSGHSTVRDGGGVGGGRGLAWCSGRRGWRERLGCSGFIIRRNAVKVTSPDPSLSTWSMSRCTSSRLRASPTETSGSSSSLSPTSPDPSASSDSNQRLSSTIFSRDSFMCEFLPCLSSQRCWNQVSSSRFVSLVEITCPSHPGSPPFCAWSLCSDVRGGRRVVVLVWGVGVGVSLRTAGEAVDSASYRSSERKREGIYSSRKSTQSCWRMRWREGPYFASRYTVFFWPGDGALPSVAMKRRVCGACKRSRVGWGRVDGGELRRVHGCSAGKTDWCGEKRSDNQFIFVKEQPQPRASGILLFVLGSGLRLVLLGS
jgi:hypothetical protein